MPLTLNIKQPGQYIWASLILTDVITKTLLFPLIDLNLCVCFYLGLFLGLFLCFLLLVLASCSCRQVFIPIGQRCCVFSVSIITDAAAILGDSLLILLPVGLEKTLKSDHFPRIFTWGIKQLYEVHLISYRKRKIQKHLCHQRHSSALFTHHCAAHLSTKHSVHKVLGCTVFLVLWWKWCKRKSKI